MKENKKLIKDVLKKTLNREDKFENLVLNLALKKMTGAKEDAAGVFYSKKQKKVSTKSLKELKQLMIMRSGDVLMWRR